MTAEANAISDLRDAVRTFVDAAIGLLPTGHVAGRAAKAGQDQDGELSLAEGSRFDAAAIQQLQPGEPLWEAILGLQANLAVRHLLESDPIIGQQLGKVMVTGSSTRPIETFEEEAPTFLANFALTGKPHNPGAFDKAFDAWHKDLYRVNEERVQLSPLLGLLCEQLAASAPLSISSSTPTASGVWRMARRLGWARARGACRPGLGGSSRWCKSVATSDLARSRLELIAAPPLNV